VVDDQKQFFSKSIAPEQVICEHWRKYLQNHDPEEVIAEFQGLFIEGQCDNRFVQEPLEKIIAADDAQSKYIYICSNSFYIIIRFWLKQKQDRLDLYSKVFLNLNIQKILPELRSLVIHLSESKLRMI